MTKPGGGSRGLCYVEYADASSAQKAVLIANKRLMRGREVNVLLSDPSVKRRDDSRVGRQGGRRAGFGMSGRGRGSVTTAENHGGGAAPPPNDTSASAVGARASAEFMRPRALGGGTRRGGRGAGRAGRSLGGRSVVHEKPAPPTDDASATAAAPLAKSNDYFASLFKK